MKNRTSLIGRLIRWQIGAMGLAWAGLLLWIVNSMLGYGGGDLDRRMMYFAKILAETAAIAEPSSEKTDKQLLITAKTFTSVVVKSLQESEKYVETYQVLNSKNELLYRTAAAPHTPILLTVGFADVKIEGVGYRAIRVESMDASKVVILAESDAFRQASMLPLIVGISTSLVLIFLLCIFVLWWVALRSFAPVTALAERLNRRVTGDFSPLDNVRTYKEIAPLVTELNDLLAREGARLDMERGFLADAAHELRTPLAAMTVQAHLLLEATDTVARQRAAERLQTGLQRVSHLLSQLLTIARIDASDAYSKSELIDASELVRECLVEHVPAAQLKSITLGLDAPDSIELFVSRLGFASIVNNLIDNSIRYSPEGSTVAICLSVSPEGCKLSVMDDGPGIDSSMRDKVFERFFRAPGTVPSGSGLGLSIVKKIASARGAIVQLGAGLGGKGLSVLLVFPNTTSGCEY